MPFPFGEVKSKSMVKTLLGGRSPYRVQDLHIGAIHKNPNPIVLEVT